MEVEDRTFEKELLWIYGEPGVGKTRSVQEKHYTKLGNKWWEGYNPIDPKHKVVLLDDIGRAVAASMVNELKIWTDPWKNTIGETKGSAVPLSYDKFIITSNYSPEECFEGIDLVAIRRRFKVIHMTGLPVVHTE